MQTLRKKTSPCKYRNDPGRFFGDGVIFKAKLIGILEVGEARGDRMCQEALQDLKMAIRAAGEHKQRITINITIDGLRLRDEKTGDSLYHHPVHKISFIAQDMTDSRAFGYIFGSPDSGHRFFGIKTDKAASQVVLAMRDLFQVVFELKKKEIELARQHIQIKAVHERQPITLTIKGSGADASTAMYSKSLLEPSSSKYATSKEMSPESVADLVDLEQELSSIQRGITQMERITPNEPPSKCVTEDDPFGDSFTQFPAYNLLPPPESSKTRHSKPLKPPEEAKLPSQIESVTTAATTTITATTISTTTTTTTNTSNTKPINDSSWLGANEMETAEEDSEQVAVSENVDALNSGDDSNQPMLSISTSKYGDAFSDLDPLGTGKSKPYVDKKYFFQELKNPPKKVLNDLSERDARFLASFPGHARHYRDVAMFDDSIQPENSTKTMEQDENTNKTSNFEDRFSPEKQEFSTSVQSNTSSKPFKLEINTHKTDDPIIGNNKALLVTDNDPFSPRMKKFDPFEDDFNKHTMDPFEFGFSKTAKKSTILPDTKIVSEDKPKFDSHKRAADENGVFNGPLHVSLPPENYSSYMSARRMERQSSDASESISRSRPNVMKQNTIDSIGNVGAKKMKPTLFGQKFSKRDSNMRRLQESDSFSENETAPEPPPRPESNSHSEPPPLPPKKQFSDIVIRPRVTSPLASTRDMPKYDYLGATKGNSSSYGQHNIDSAPALPLPLPSRRIGRSDANYPGPGRPEKKGNRAEDDYLTPITATKSDVPILLPPPQTKGSMKNRVKRQDSSAQNKTDATSTKHAPDAQDVVQTSMPSALPDITLSQLLTLGIDELASKLNVPVSKLNTMTIVELTKYLSDFIEKSSQKSIPISDTQPHETSQTSSVVPPLKQATETAIFKVSFDDANESTFIAKFDDNFGEDNDFTPNFDHFNEIQNSSVDKYAVFREIMDQDHSDNQQPTDSKRSDDSNGASSDAESPTNETESAVPVATKIDTKITEAISQAKDRYAALRDIILVEDLFEKQPTNTMPLDSIETITEETENGFNEETDKTFEEAEIRSSPEVNISINLEDQDESEPLKTETTPTISQPILSSKDDLEIDEYMNRALSNLSLDSRDHLSPLSSKSPVTKSQNASTSPIQMQQRKPSPLSNVAKDSQESLHKTTLNDMSTSPIPIQKSPSVKSALTKSPLSLTTAGTSIPMSKSPILSQSCLKSPSQTSSISLAKTSAAVDTTNDIGHVEAAAPSESWAVFDNDKSPKPKELGAAKSPKDSSKAVAESPCSSDDKNDWKAEREYSKKWPRGHTSSSSRDLSPWDDDADYKHRGALSHADRHGFYMRHARRMNSCDDDYEYEEEMAKRRERRNTSKSSVNRSRENFDSDSQNWYHPSNHRNWSPIEDDENCDRTRSFERACYERSTYGPPYEKRDPKSLSYSSDRHGYKGYDKRKYYRDYARSGYDVDDYDEYEQRLKSRKDYEEMYESSPAFGMRPHKAGKDYFYEREKRSFDRESIESFDSAGRRRKSFGSGEMYGSLDNRGRSDYRERYTSADRKRSLRKSNKNQRSNEEEYEPDSEGESAIRRGPGDTRSLQRASNSGRPRKSSGSSPWDGEDITPTTAQKAWKRPASASESERKLNENRRVLNHTLSGSDGEKERRFYRRPRSRDKDSEMRSNYATTRYARGDDYEYEGGDYDDEEDHYREFRRKDRNGASFSDRRKVELERNIESMHRISKSNRDVYYQSEKDRYAKFDWFDQQSKGNRTPSRREREYEAYEDTPHPSASNKFNFETTDQGFESDFTATPEKNLRFSTDFSGDKEPPKNQSQVLSSGNHSQSTVSGSEFVPTPPQQKLRFDDKITVSQFNLFEDDFSKAEFTFENQDQWVEELPKKINLKNVTSGKRQENIKKSESVNIFAKNLDDPFEDDDFFKKSSPDINSCNNSNKKNGVSNNSHNNNVSVTRNAANNNNRFKWENNFAKFDENI